MNEPIICTARKPWKPEYGTPVRHSNVHEVGEQMDGYPGGDIQKYRCSNCGATWTEELPQ